MKEKAAKGRAKECSGVQRLFDLTDSAHPRRNCSFH